MQARWVLLGYFFLVFVGGALLAPWLYKLAKALAFIDPQLAKRELFFFVQNAILIVALAGSWLLFRCRGVKTVQDTGLTNPLKESARIGGGFLLGFTSLALVALLALILGMREFHQGLGFWHFMKRLADAAFTAWGVAVMEELLFRGAIFGVLKMEFDWKIAVVLSSAMYGIMHFLASPKWAGDVTWLSGLQLMPQVLAGLVDWDRVFPAFLNLTLAGSILAVAYQRTGNLWFSIGVHAGWIFWLRFYTSITQSNHGIHSVFSGTDRMIDGWLAFMVMTATFLIFIRLKRTSKSGAAPEAATCKP